MDHAEKHTSIKPTLECQRHFESVVLKQMFDVFKKKT